MKVFITDGTAAGFYTAVFLSYREKDAVITSQENRQLSFDTEVINVETDREKAERVRQNGTFSGSNYVITSW